MLHPYQEEGDLDTMLQFKLTLLLDPKWYEIYVLIIYWLKTILQ
jgi:hypothetical protein